MPMTMEPDIHIGDEEPGDRAEVWKVNEAAFERSDEADLVDRLRGEGVVLLSLVAEIEHQIVGHILFSRMSIEFGQGRLPAVSLAPMAVRPSHQKRGIGGHLIRRGLRKLRGSGERIVVVVGHKDYYPRFGFGFETSRYLSSPFPVDAVMAMELSEGALAGVRGALRYATAFGL
jgi:putative acetyltransferase